MAMGWQRRWVTHSTPVMVALFMALYCFNLAVSGVISATVPSAVQAASDPVVATTVTACGVRINWVVPASNGGKPIMVYTVYATGGGTIRKKMKLVEGASTTTTFVTGLKRRTAYKFEVTATNEIGEGAHGPATEEVTTQDFRKYIFVSDFPNDRILRFDFATKLFKDVFVQKACRGPMHGIHYSTPRPGIVHIMSPAGQWRTAFDDALQPRSFYVASEGTNSILMYDACDGSFVKQFAYVPGEPRGLKFHILPSAHKVPRQQKMLLVASHYRASILKFNALTGSPLGTYASGVPHPADFVIGPQSSKTASNLNQNRAPEDIFVTSMTENAVIQYQNSSGVFKSKFTDKKVNTAYGLAFGQDTKWDNSGRIVTTAADTIQTGYLYVLGPYAGNVIVKFDQTLYVLDKNTIRTYDAETGEFLEVFTSHDGMDGTYLVFHDM